MNSTGIVVTLPAEKKKTKHSSIRLKANYCKTNRTLFINSYTSELRFVSGLIKLFIEELCYTVHCGCFC